MFPYADIMPQAGRLWKPILCETFGGGADKAAAAVEGEFYDSSRTKMA